MKTNLFKKSGETKNSTNSKFEVMSNKEMQSIQGGLKGYLVRNANGSYSIIISVLN